MNIEMQLLLKQALINTLSPLCLLLCGGFALIVDAVHEAHRFAHTFDEQEPQEGGRHE